MVPLLLGSSCTVRRSLGLSTDTTISQEATAQVATVDLGLLQWPQRLDAVRSEVEILDGIPASLDPDKPSSDAIYRNGHVYGSAILLPMGELKGKKTQPLLYYRVRAYDLDGNPVGSYFQLQPVSGSLQKVPRNAPVPRSSMDDNGSELLYPVYAYTGNPGATQYEVEVTDHRPENPNGTAPSRYRVFAQTTKLTDLYEIAPKDRYTNADLNWTNPGNLV